MTQPTDSTPQSPTLLTYIRGQWTTGPFPIRHDDPWTDYENIKREAGYTQFTMLGEDDYSALSLDIWRGTPQTGDAHFIIEVNTPEGGDTVGAGDIADLMALLAAWAPALQAAVLADLWRAAEYDALGGGVEYNKFAAIGALVAQGAEERGEWAASQRRRAAERRRSAQKKDA